MKVLNVGQKVRITNPISDMEKDLAPRGLVFSFVRWSKPHGFAVCREGEDGHAYHLHPEALSGLHEKRTTVRRVFIPELRTALISKIASVISVATNECDLAIDSWQDGEWPVNGFEKAVHAFCEQVWTDSHGKRE